MASKFAIGQRVQVVKVGRWNGTPPRGDIVRCITRIGQVREINCDTIGVDIAHPGKYLGVVQFLPDELTVLDNTSGDSVE